MNCADYPLALPTKERYKLRCGTYSTPPFQYGQRVRDAVLGRVTIVGMTDAKISWPVSQNGGRKSLVVYRGLLRALKTESNQAVCYWWGVAPCTVSKWRQELGIKGTTKGTRELRSIYFKGKVGDLARVVGYTRLSTPERCEKIAASKRGKPRPAHVHVALRKANVGRKLSEETRRNMGESAVRRGSRPPWIGRAWTAKETKVVMDLRLSPKEVAQKIDRTVVAIRARRLRLLAR